LKSTTFNAETAELAESAPPQKLHHGGTQRLEIWLPQDVDCAAAREHHTTINAELAETFDAAPEAAANVFAELSRY